LSVRVAEVPERSTTGAGRWLLHAASATAMASIPVHPSQRLIDTLLRNAAS
jgi:hypothetical protein